MAALSPEQTAIVSAQFNEQQAAAIVVLVKQGLDELKNEEARDRDTAMQNLGITIRSELQATYSQATASLQDVRDQVIKSREEAEQHINQISVANKEQRDVIEVEYNKLIALKDEMYKLKGEISDLDLRMANSLTELNDRDESIRAIMKETKRETQEGFQAYEVHIQEVVKETKREFDRVRDGVKSMLEANVGNIGGNRTDAPKGLIDTRDYKVPQMPENCTVEQFKKWRHDATVFLEAHAKWKGAKKILHLTRLGTVEVNEEQFDKAVKKAQDDHLAETSKDLIPDLRTWSFAERSRELYQLISVKLNSSTFADYKDEDDMNGFELWRQLNKKLDPLRKDVAFHLELAIQAMASTRETNFDGTYNRMLEIEKAARNYKSLIGEPVDEKLLGRVLYAITDDDTTEKIDKDDSGVPDKNDEEFYSKFKDWLGEKWEKQAGRTVVKSHQKPKSSNMQVGALAPDAAAKPEVDVAAPDPWSFGDPWYGGCTPCNDLDAFGKGGKGKPTGPMSCWNCDGTGHPARLCPSPPNVAKTGPKCSVCGGYGHTAAQCTSQGGGQYTPPVKGGKTGSAGKY